MNKALIELIKDNQELPIIPLVNYEVVPNDSCDWVGSFGNAYIGEYASYNNRFFDDRDDFKEYIYDNNEDLLCDNFKYNPRINEGSLELGKCTKEQLEMNNICEEKMNMYLDEVADQYFKKAIIVYIDLPEE